MEKNKGGRPRLPNRVKPDIRITLDVDQLMLLKREALMRRTSVSQLIRMAVDLYLDSLTPDTTEQRPAA